MTRQEFIEQAILQAYPILLERALHEYDASNFSAIDGVALNACTAARVLADRAGFSDKAGTTHRVRAPRTPGQTRRT